MKKKYILMLSLVILFASYSCIKKSKALRPDVTHDLSMSIDYYGTATPPSSVLPIVQVSYTKDIVSAENESDLIPVVFSDEKLLEGVIQIPEKAEVTITINPVTPGSDATLIKYLSGDVPADFNPTNREYIFTMDTNKSFEVILSKAPIEMLDFKFEVVGNGTVEISSTKNASTTKYTATEVSPQTVSIVKDDFNLYTIVAEAKPSVDYKFSAWSGKGSGTSTTLNINDTNMAGTIKATFVAETKYSFTFATSGTGKVEVVAKNKTNSTDIKTLLSSGTGSRSLQIGELTFKDYNVTAKATADSGHAFEKWSYNNSTANPLTITSAMEGTITANFKAISSVGWYEIWDKDELIHVANQVNASNETFQTNKYKLMADIDYGGSNHSPIGHDGAMFRGIINGNDKTIRNAKFGMSIGYDAYTGFIGFLAEIGVVSNLIIDSSCTITSPAPFVGSIAARSAGGSIYNSVNKADIKASGSIGGIVGYGNGIISNVYNTGNIYVNSSNYRVHVGGVVGILNDNTYLKNAYNTGNITYKGSSTYPYIGGVFGNVAANLYITNVYNTGEITNLGSSSTATNYTGGVFGNVSSSYTFQAANVYFTGNTSLPEEGFGSSSPRSSDANVVGRTNSLSGLETTFNNVAGMSGVWKNVGGRPVIDGLGEGK